MALLEFTFKEPIHMQVFGKLSVYIGSAERGKRIADCIVKKFREEFGYEDIYWVAHIKEEPENEPWNKILYGEKNEHQSK